MNSRRFRYQTARTTRRRLLVPPGADDKTVQEYKKHFAEWVVASGLAEVLEHFGLFLTVMHQHALAIYKVRGLGKDIGDFAQAQQRFHENPGIKSKLDTLAQRFITIVDRKALEKSSNGTYLRSDN
jgi:hypothetical protein